jgi:hypothetical protein
VSDATIPAEIGWAMDVRLGAGWSDAMGFSA